MEKRCSKCNKTLALNKFYPRSDSNDGVRGVCKKCMNKGFYSSHKRVSMVRREV